MTSTVRIDWQRWFDNKQMWNDVSAWAIEYFGLPGDRYICHVNVNWMEFIFEDSRDALMMSLRWNAPIVTKDVLTVELVGSLMQ